VVSGIVGPFIGGMDETLPHVNPTRQRLGE
jgi:hypothetical protein